MAIPFPDPDAGKTPAEMLREMPFFVLRSEVNQGHYKPEDHIGIGNRHLALTDPKIEVKLTVYDRAASKLREYDINGAVGEMRDQIDPSPDDLLLVQALTFIDVMDGCGLGIGDLRDMVGLALERHLEKDDANPIMQDKLLQLHKRLGGK